MKYKDIPMEEKKKIIQKAIKKPGALHKALKVKIEEKMPEAKPNKMKK